MKDNLTQNIIYENSFENEHSVYLNRKKDEEVYKQDSVIFNKSKIFLSGKDLIS